MLVEYEKVREIFKDVDIKQGLMDNFPGLFEDVEDMGLRISEQDTLEYSIVVEASAVDKGTLHKLQAWMMDVVNDTSIQVTVVVEKMTPPQASGRRLLSESKVYQMIRFELTKIKQRHAIQDYMIHIIVFAVLVVISMCLCMFTIYSMCCHSEAKKIKNLNKSTSNADVHYDCYGMYNTCEYDDYITHPLYERAC